MRIVAGLGSTAGFFYVFPRMPLVDAYAISFAAPFFMVGLAVPLLGEQVGWRRWTAVAVGFVGVIVMLDPLGISFHAMSLVVLGATFCYSLSTVLVRLISRHDSDAATLFWFSIVVQRGLARRRHPGLGLAERRSTGSGCCCSACWAGWRRSW